MYNNVLDEPSPLGLRLRKSPSLLDLIQMKLAQANEVNSDSSKKKEAKSSAVSSSNERLKASNFPANVLRIGNWEVRLLKRGLLLEKKEKIVSLQITVLAELRLLCSVYRDMKVTWWQSATMPSTSLCGKSWMAVLRAR
jgi:hypothetical protein